MSGHVSGINEVGLDNLAMEIVDYADKINKIFNQLQLLVDQTSSCFIAPEGEQFRKKFSEQAEHYSMINQNILSYASDFVKVKDLYQRKTIDIADQVSKK